MKRGTKIMPAWDCICGPCGRRDCPGHGVVGDQHGRSSEEWIYWVIADDGLTALSLSVRAPISHPSTPEWIKIADEKRRLAGQLPNASDITLHCAFQTSSDGAGSSPGGCMFLDDKPCHADFTSGLDADAFWLAHGEQGALQAGRVDTFWKALELEHAKRDQQARARRVKACPDCPSVCMTCNGESFVLDPFPVAS
jgi:hypothetical protein